MVLFPIFFSFFLKILKKIINFFKPPPPHNQNDNEPHDKDEISLTKDDKILLLDDRSNMNDGWWLGQLIPDPEINLNGYFQVGVFPKDYVVKL